MANNASEYGDFAAVKERLDQIVSAVSDDSMPLDEALDMYEEAIALGMRASELLEEGIDLEEGVAEAEVAAGQVVEAVIEAVEDDAPAVEATVAEVLPEDAGSETGSDR